MKYKYLNEVLLNWGDSDENIQDNNIIKSNDIKKKIDQCFIYRVEDEPSRIKIFDDGSDNGWAEFEKYRNKVYINGKHIKLTDIGGYTIDTFDPGEYNVYIEDIDQITYCKCMFYECAQLVSVPLFDTSKVDDMMRMFYKCTQLISVPEFDTSEVGDMYEMFYKCTQLVSVPLFDTSKVGDMDDMFLDCDNLNQDTIDNWKYRYNFETNGR